METKERLRREANEAKRRVILEAVSEIFENEGVATVKMQTIAQRIGISVGALYKLFASKEELYGAYVAYQIDLFFARWERECERKDARECLHRFVALKFETFQAKRKAIEDPAVADPLFFVRLHHKQREAITPIIAKLAELFAALHHQAVTDKKDSTKLAYLFNSCVTGHIEYWLFGGGALERPETVLDRFLSSVDKRPLHG